MKRYFNVTGACNPKEHYMVDLQSRLEEIKRMVDRGQYFTINRARQYGKTTTLQALKKYLADSYVVISLDFQMLSRGDFENETTFSAALAREILKRKRKEWQMPDAVTEAFCKVAESKEQIYTMAGIFQNFGLWCRMSDRPIVFMIDEVDSATNNQVFLDFLAQIRGCYIERFDTPTFQSVILAGVHDVKNMKRKLRSEEDHRLNSPWNIAADFLVDMSFSADDIAGMLADYEADYHTGMDVAKIAGAIYDYTSGYPFLVSRICQLLDERISESNRFRDKSAAWTKEGFLEAVKLLLTEQNTLFESLINKLHDYPELKEMLQELLFEGKAIVYVPGLEAMEMALMFGFVKKVDGTITIANRVFEILLYNMMLAEPEMQKEQIYTASLKDKNQFVQNGHLDMRLVLEKFVQHFHSLYGTAEQAFCEADGRRFFLLYLRPIINGVGNYYIESQTRNMERTDVIVDYRGEQFIIEMKIWRGNAYHIRGERQLSDYLDYYHLEKGYMLSFNFNKRKEIGVQEIKLGNKVLIEAVV